MIKLALAFLPLDDAREPATDMREAAGLAAASEPCAAGPAGSEGLLRGNHFIQIRK